MARSAARNAWRSRPGTIDVVTSAEPTPSENGEKPPASTTLVLVRHAVTAHTGPLLSGRMPGVDLSETGIKQAEDAGARLAGLPITAIYASPIERTRQTAEHIAKHHDLPVQPLEGVIEADYGEWTGGKIADLAKTDLWKTVQVVPSRARFPNGESIAEMQTRTVAALEAVVADHPGETIVVVSPASVTVFELSAHGAAMVKCNDTGSLDELLPPPPADSAQPTAEAAAAGKVDGA